MAEAEQVENQSEVAPSSSVRVRCSACNYTLLEASVETPDASRVWLKTKCKGCRTFNVILFKGGRLSVQTVAQ